MKHLSSQSITIIKATVFVVCLTPLLHLAGSILVGTLGADPVQAMTHTTGVWALRFLLLTLAISPLRQATGWNWVVRLRRTIALYAFFYTCLHVLIYLLFDQIFDTAEIAKDIIKRPHITAGFLSFSLMIPLAITSTQGMMRRLGGRRWQQLHRLTYPVAAAAVLHYFWLVKRDVSVPTLYAVILALLLCVRLSVRPRKIGATEPKPRNRVAHSS